MVDGVERVTNRFYLIPKEVEKLLYSIRLNGKIIYCSFSKSQNDVDYVFAMRY